MERAELAARLVEADESEREALLREHAASADASLAYVLKDICLDAWHRDTARAIGAATALEALARQNQDREVAALAAWGAGIAALVRGQMEEAIARLNEAETLFVALGKTLAAASTQISKLIALSMLGRYDEAIECGLSAREVFTAQGDTLTTGKIELNIGNMYGRRDRYTEAEQFLLAARERFRALDDQKQLAKINNSLALIHSLQHRFRSAEQLYEQALHNAEAAGSLITQAEIEASMGNLALFQGRYDRALDYLERSRRKYAALGMPHQSAIAEQEIADVYLELNLAPEAAAIYQRIIPTFAALGMRAEQARSLAHHARAFVLLGQMERAHALLVEAGNLYAAEENAVGEAMVNLTGAQLAHNAKDYAAVEASAREAEAPLERAGAWGRLLLARWLRGDAARALGHADEARTLLEQTLRDAVEQAQPQVAQRCQTSLGLLAADAGDTQAAEQFFLQAVALIEDLRAPLPAEEFRTAFFTDKLVPYDELARLCLEDARRDRATEALAYVERARSRALVEALGGRLKLRPQPRDPFDAELVTRLEELREELNWFYSRINRPPQADAARGSTAGDMAALHEEVRRREQESLEITRQLQHRGGATELLGEAETLDIAQLQSDLGTETALVEYTCLGGELLAFVVTDEGVEVVRHLGSEDEARAALEKFRFQIGALRHGAERMRRHLPNLTGRVRRHLEELYDLVLAPVEERVGARRLVVVPHRVLHYVPFHALHDGVGYVVERREVSYAPSAVALRHCLARPHHTLRRALLLGVADEQTPRVRDEINTLAPLFAESVALLDAEATHAAVFEHAPSADVVHLACHGQFRPDNPLFSSLRLSDGWLTVRDAYKLDLHCELVALSACETGVSAVAPGDELMGLARGFFSAGAPSLLLSLWTVDDAATASLMSSFYRRLSAGDRLGAALRQAQLELMREQPHPFFWSPFVLVGRY
ncbi:MAG TPA: CHAT domain-containing tetratricopeptide repeat protein [Pyrinomonadaceae bacterium]|jgi:CHAT domain-containing protein